MQPCGPRCLAFGLKLLQHPKHMGANRKGSSYTLLIANMIIFTRDIESFTDVTSITLIGIDFMGEIWEQNVI